MVSTWKSYIVEREGSWQHSLVTCQQLQYRGFFPVKASQTYRHIIACYTILYCTHPLIQLKYIGITRCTICRPSIHHSPPAVNFGEGEQGERRRLCPSHSWRWPLSCRQWKGTCMTIVYWIVGHWSTHNYSEESLSWRWPLSWNSGDWGTYTTEVSNIQYTTHTHIAVSFGVMLIIQVSTCVCCPMAHKEISYNNHTIVHWLVGQWTTHTAKKDLKH